MNSRLSLALALCTTIGAGGAHAGGNVYWSIGITAPVVTTVTPGYYAPATVYAPSPVLYVPPPRVYYQPQVVYERVPHVVYERPVRVYRHGHRRHWDKDRDGIPDRYDSYDNRQDWGGHGHHWQHSYGVEESRYRY